MSVNLGTAMGYLDLDTSNFKKGFTSALSDLKVFQDQSASVQDKIAGFGSTAKGVGSSLTKYITTPLLGVGTLAVKTSADFDAGMSQVQAIAGATSGELEKLRDKAIEMGAKTKFSATESAEAFQYMAQAGWDTNAMLDGIEGVMNLAAASGEDLALSASIVADSLTGFGLSASDSARFADVLAEASARSNTNVAEMGETFKYVAPVAGSLGYSIEDTAVAVGLMANAGIKGSQAGTSLRSIFTRLVKPVGEAKTAVEELNISLENTDGTMKPLSQVLTELRGKFEGMTQAEKTQYAAMIAGQEGMSGFLALINASDEDFQSLTDSINNAGGSAEEMAEVMMDNLPGALEQASGAVETLLIRIGDVLTPIVTKVVNAFTSFVEKLGGASDATIAFAVAVGAVIAGIGPALLILGQFALAINNMITLYNRLTRAQDGNTGSTILNRTAHVATSAAMKVRQIANYTVQFIRNTAAVVSNTAAQILNAAASSRVGITMAAAAKKVLIFAAANRTALLVTLGLVAPIVALIAYMAKTGDSAEEVAQKITDFSNRLAETITGFAQQFPSMVEGITQSLITVINSITQQLPTIINALVPAFIQVFTTLINTIPSMLPVMIQAGVTLFMGLVQALTQIVGPLLEMLPTILNALIEGITTLIPALLEAGITLFMALVEAIPMIIPPLVEAIPQIIQAIINIIPTLLPALINGAIQLFMAFVQAIPQIVPQLIAAIPQIINAIVAQIPVLIPALINGAIQLFMAFVQAIPQIVPQLIAAAPQIVMAIIQGVLTLLGSLFNTGVDLLKQLWNGIKSWVGTLGSNVVGAVKGLPGKIKKGIGSLVSIGKDWLEGLWEGIKSKASAVKNKIASIGSEIKDLVKSAFKIGSPSKWMRDEIGKNMMIGWANGLIDNTKLVLGAISDGINLAKQVYEDNPIEFDPNQIPDDPENYFHRPNPYTNSPYGNNVDNSYTGGDTYNFYSPVKLNPMEAARQMKKAKRDLILGY